jgi:hypothetical protein
MRFRRSAVPDQITGGVPDDWWTIVLGSGFRWTVEQLKPDAAEQIRSANLAGVRCRNISAVETNAIFATARKPA